MHRPSFECSQVGSIRLHVMPTDRFKTFAISAYIGTPLREESVTRTALIPFVLRRGTTRYPDTKMMRERQDDLFGAGFGFDIYKRGDYQIVQFRMDIIDDRYVSQQGSLLEEGTRFLVEAITSPVTENGVFLNKFVDAEKLTVRKRLDAIVNDKIRYAAERCLEEMCQDEPYRLRPLGLADQLDEIGPSDLYTHYQSWLADSPIDLYIVGNTTLQQVEELVRGLFPSPSQAPVSYRMENKSHSAGEVKTIVERLDVNQGKLNMGLRLPVTYSDPRYEAAMMYNGILGGYPHAKLFTNVREKASLAYYASSRYDGHKGILTIQSGIEIANYEKAVDIIRKQLAAIEQGEISELEMAQTKAMITNQLLELQDGAFELIAFDYNNVLSGQNRTVEGMLAQVERVTPSDVQAVARQVQLDTIYFLRDGKGE